MDELRDEIAAILANSYDGPASFDEGVADRILSLPRIKEALKCYDMVKGGAIVNAGTVF